MNAGLNGTVHVHEGDMLPNQGTSDDILTFVRTLPFLSFFFFFFLFHLYIFILSYPSHNFLLGEKKKKKVRRRGGKSVELTMIPASLGTNAALILRRKK
jgi:hypothetical protein